MSTFRYRKMFKNTALVPVFSSQKTKLASTTVVVATNGQKFGFYSMYMYNCAYPKIVKTFLALAKLITQKFTTVRTDGCQTVDCLELFIIFGDLKKPRQKCGHRSSEAAGCMAVYGVQRGGNA